MPRWTISVPAPQSSSRYFARRPTARISRPSRRAARLRGTGQRSARFRTTTAVIVRRARCGSMPRRVISTSGSSGIGNYRGGSRVIVVAARNDGAAERSNPRAAQGILWLSLQGNIPKLAPFNRVSRSPDDPFQRASTPRAGRFAFAARRRGHVSRRGVRIAAATSRRRRRRPPRTRIRSPRRAAAGRRRAVAGVAEPGPDRRSPVRVSRRRDRRPARQPRALGAGLCRSREAHARPARRRARDRDGAACPHAGGGDRIGQGLGRVEPRQQPGARDRLEPPHPREPPRRSRALPAEGARGAEREPRRRLPAAERPARQQSRQGDEPARGAAPRAVVPGPRAGALRGRAGRRQRRRGRARAQGDPGGRAPAARLGARGAVRGVAAAEDLERGRSRPARRAISRPIRSRARCASPMRARWSPTRISPRRAGSSSSCSRTIRATPTSCSPSRCCRCSSRTGRAPRRT